MRFVRHLAAAALAVAVITGLGLLWAHAGTRVPARADTLRPDPVTAVDRAGALIKACLIETVLAAVVIRAGAIRRRRRRAAATGDAAGHEAPVRQWRNRAR